MLKHLFVPLWRQEWRRGEVLLMALALATAVGALSCVDFITGRLNAVLEVESHQFLAGDLLLTSDHPWSDGFARIARQHSLTVTTSMAFPSMISSKDQSQLSSLKAVEAEYPLRGKLRVTQGDGQADQEVTEGPTPGTVWPEASLANRLGVGVGDMVRVGKAQLKITHLLSLDPERPSGFSGLMPQLLMSLSDIPATELVQPGSRLRYRLHIAGAPTAVKEYAAWAKKNLALGERVETLADSREDVQKIISDAQHYLSLTSLLAVILAAVVIALSARSYVGRHEDDGAILRCLGAKRAQVALVHLTLFVMAGALASVLGVVVGFVAQHFLSGYLASLSPTPLPAAKWFIGLRGWLVGLLLLIFFVTPLLLRLARLPVVMVLRPGHEGASGSSAMVYFPGIILCMGLIFWLAGNAKLGAISALGLAGLLLVDALLVKALLWGALKIMAALKYQGSVSYVLRNFLRRPAGLMQICALTLGLTALMLPSILHSDFIQSWRDSLPKDAHNNFIINIQPDQLASVKDNFSSAQLAVPEFYPMMGGRLKKINEEDVHAQNYKDARTQRLVNREFNLSYSQDLPLGNSIESGHWFFDDTTQFSVEKGLAKTLNLKLGDKLTFEVGGVEYQGPITSLRKLSWGSLKVNFFVIVPTGVLPVDQASYITSFYLSPAGEAVKSARGPIEPHGTSQFVPELIRNFPNLTVIDVGRMLLQIQQLLQQMVGLLTSLLWFSLLAGMGVLWAGLHSLYRERAREVALWKSLGLTGSQCRRRLHLEYLLLGLMAGTLAAMGSIIIAWALSRYAFELAYAPGWRFLWGPVVGALLGVLAGGPFVRSLVKPQPMAILGS